MLKRMVLYGFYRKCCNVMSKQWGSGLYRANHGFYCDSRGIVNVGRDHMFSVCLERDSDRWRWW